MAAFAAAIEMGADMIEADVRRTGAGRIVLAHDPLRGDPGDGLPGLADLVRLAAGRITLDIELKGRATRPPFSPCSTRGRPASS